MTPPAKIEANTMTTKFKIGDHVRWNSEAGRVSGRIIRIYTRETEYKGHPRHASADETAVRDQERQDGAHRDA